MYGHHWGIFLKQINDEQATTECKGAMMKMLIYLHSFGRWVLLSGWWRIISNGSLEVDLKPHEQIEIIHCPDD